ncbi:MAG: hypothetical protein A2132_00690 [Nitrospirae bacterium RBG_16_43_11]|nr:MAG: hypothetical protein A2132_00690 [Nitrospirae bacterium RBG_16_43_11]
MKFKKERVVILSINIIEGLIKNGFIAQSAPKEELVKKVQNTITDDLMVEEKLNEEVREILKSYSKQLEQESVNYQKMFQMVKDKLVKERGIIL